MKPKRKRVREEVVNEQIHQTVTSSIAHFLEPHALLPLFDWVTSDLPSDTDSRNLDDANTKAVLKANGVDQKNCQVQVTQETISRLSSIHGRNRIYSSARPKETDGANEEVTRDQDLGGAETCVEDGREGLSGYVRIRREEKRREEESREWSVRIT